MAARVAQQAVIPGGQFDWRRILAALPKLLLVISVLSALGMGLMKLNDPGFLPIQKVRAQGAFINLTEAMLLSRVGDINGGYFNVDVRAVQYTIESLPWVDRASVRRIWPDTLMISVTEQHAVARWHDKALLNQRGEVFSPDKNTFPAGLPVLNGPLDTQQQLLEHYRAMSAMLTVTGLTIRQLDMDERRSLTLHFDNGLKLLLGRDAYYLRLERFVRVYDKVLAAEINHIQRIDMRYTNGFSMLRKQ